MGPLTIEHQTKTDIDLVIGEIHLPMSSENRARKQNPIKRILDYKGDLFVQTTVWVPLIASTPRPI